MKLTVFRMNRRKRPGKAGLVILAMFAVILAGPYLVFGPVDVTQGTGSLDFDTLTGGMYWQIFLSGILLALVWLLGWWDITALSGQLERRGLRPFFAIVLYPLIGIGVFALMLRTTNGTEQASQILFVVLGLNFFVGLSEELLFRGFVFGGLRQRHSLRVAIGVSAIAFGLLHLVNAGAGQDLMQTLFQVVNATALGVLFCGLVLQANTLWPAIALHMIWNSYAMMGLAAVEIRGNGLATAPVAPAELSVWVLILPATIMLISYGVLRNYSNHTGHRLRDIVPTT